MCTVIRVKALGPVFERPSMYSLEGSGLEGPFMDLALVICSILYTVRAFTASQPVTDHNEMGPAFWGKSYRLWPVPSLYNQLGWWAAAGRVHIRA